MWTHLQPHVDETLTADSIQRHARLSIYRAINMGRIVAMAGSGITRAYGLPSWDSLGAFLVHATAHEIDRVADSNQGIQALEAIRPLIEQLKVTCQTPDSDPEHRDSATDEEDWWVISLTPDRAKKLNTQTLMELCESVLDRLPDDEVQGYSRRWAARRELSRRLRNGEEKQTRARLKDLFAKDTQISHSTSDARILNDVVTDLKNRGYESSAELIRGAIDFEWDEPSRALDYPTLLYEIARGKISPQEAYDSTSHSPSSDTGRQASFGPMVRMMFSLNAPFAVNYIHQVEIVRLPSILFVMKIPASETIRKEWQSRPVCVVRCSARHSTRVTSVNLSPSHLSHVPTTARFSICMDAWMIRITWCSPNATINGCI